MKIDERMSLDTLAVLAHGLKSKQYSKEVLFNALVESVKENRPFTVAEQAAIYRHCLPPIPGKPKSPQHWIGSAIADASDVRFYLQYMYSNGNRLIGTDGHRMHIWRTDKYPVGYYDQAMTPVTVDHPFVDVDKVIPKIDNMTWHRLIEFQPVHTTGAYPTLCCGDTWVSRDYLIQACHGIKNPIIYIRDPYSALLITGDDPDKLAVVMSIAPRRDGADGRGGAK